MTHKQKQSKKTDSMIQSLEICFVYLTRPPSKPRPFWPQFSRKILVRWAAPQFDRATSRERAKQPPDEHAQENRCEVWSIFAFNQTLKRWSKGQWVRYVKIPLFLAFTHPKSSSGHRWRTEEQRKLKSDHRRLPLRPHSWNIHSTCRVLSVGFRTLAYFDLDG